MNWFVLAQDIIQSGTYMSTEVILRFDFTKRLNEFYTLLTVRLFTILANNQLDALFLVFIYLFHLSTCFEHQMLITRRSNCINTSSGMISLCK